MDETQHRCALCRAYGHWERFCPHRRGDGRSCFRCGSADHQMRDCKADMKKLKEKEDHAKFASGEYEYDEEDANY